MDGRLQSEVVATAKRAAATCSEEVVKVGHHDPVMDAFRLQSVLKPATRICLTALIVRALSRRKEEAPVDLSTREGSMT